MSLSYRPFVDPDDAERVVALMRRMAKWNENGIGWLHPGDVVWRLYQNLTLVPEKIMRIVENDSGEVVALVEIFAPDGVCIHMPEGAADLAEVVAFVEDRARNELGAKSAEEGDGSPLTIEFETTSLQPRAAGLLRDLGYVPAGDHAYRLNGKPLNGELPAPRLRDGAIIRPVHDAPADIQKRVDLHRDVWTGSKFDVPGYQRLRSKPLYRSDLDLVVETPDGELAAYCIIWWDPVTKTGEFEPVGTAERFRRRGYGKAVVLEGLRRLRELGAEYAVVINSMQQEYEPSRWLYISAGFETVFTFDRFSKQV
jgi:ribosomal protein S18 acetylase RimI-like enzyme